MYTKNKYISIDQEIKKKTNVNVRLHLHQFFIQKKKN